MKQTTIFDKLKNEIMFIEFTNHNEVDSFLNELENHYNVVDYKITKEDDDFLIRVDVNEGEFEYPVATKVMFLKLLSGE